MTGKFTNRLRRRRNLNLPSHTRRIRNRIPKLPQGLQVTFKSFSNIHLRLVRRAARRHATRQIRHIRRSIVLNLFKNDRVFQTDVLFSKAADLRIALSVPIGMASPALPGTVTTFGFTGCLKWQWLPVVRTCRQPSDSIRDDFNSQSLRTPDRKRNRRHRPRGSGYGPSNTRPNHPGGSSARQVSTPSSALATSTRPLPRAVLDLTYGTSARPENVCADVFGLY